ncbi:ribonuclease [Clostridiaceae bacterium]|nr:ribonuclease [Lachnospiraceae bacterium]NBH16711.1 ribonuclease [Clostridiaceae bacterium]
MILVLVFGLAGGCGTDTGKGSRLAEAPMSEAEGQKEVQISESESQISSLEKEKGEKGEQESRKQLDKETEQLDKETEQLETSKIKTDAEEISVSEDGTYITRDEVALYLHLYGRLPDNYITKKEAQNLGWDSKKGNLDQVAPGMSIGGSHFGNYEGLLPEKKGRKYYECDLEYEGGYRGAKRLIYSNDGLIFYTEDHYQTFEQLY